MLLIKISAVASVTMGCCVLLFNILLFISPNGQVIGMRGMKLLRTCIGTQSGTQMYLCRLKIKWFWCISNRQNMKMNARKRRWLLKAPVCCLTQCQPLKGPQCVHCGSVQETQCCQVHSTLGQWLTPLMTTRGKSVHCIPHYKEL